MSLAELPPPPEETDGLNVAPHDDTAERQVLGAMLTDPRTAAQVAELVDGTDFYQHTHELIYNALQERALLGKPIEPHIIADDLASQRLTKTQTALDRIGGPAYLHDLVQGLVTAANAAWHVDRIIDHALRRRAINAARDALQRLIQPGDTPLEQILEDTRTNLEQLPTTNTDGKPSTWQPIDVGAILDSAEDTSPKPTLMARTDGRMLLYPQAIHSISGEPGSGKTWAAVLATAQELADGHNVLYLDFEDRATTLVNRLRGIGTPDDQIRTHLRYIRPEAALDHTSRRIIDTEATSCHLAVIDGITEAMTLHGLSLMDNEDVARWLALIPHHIANQGPAVLQIDHVVKNADNRGRYAIGGQHKLAGITGVAYKMLTIRSFGRECYGQAKLVIDKDKHGNVGPNGATAAEIHLDARHPEDGITAWIAEPQEASFSADGEMRPTHLMEKVSIYLEHVADATGKQIEQAVRGKAQYVRKAIRFLIEEGFVATSDGPHGSTLHRSLEPFREASDDAS